jgi:hypothetical protein
MRGLRVFIIEPDITPRTLHLQDALEAVGVEYVIVRDPFGRSGAETLKRFTVDAALVHKAHAKAADLVGEMIPVVIYTSGTAVSTIIRRLSEAVQE